MKPRHTSKFKRHSLFKGDAGASFVVSLHKQLSESLGHVSPSSLEEILNIPFPGDAVDPDDFRDRYLLSEVCSKYPFKVNGIDRTLAALTKFGEAEAQCALVNSTLRTPTIGPNGLEWHTVIQTARAKIGRLLGPFNWNQVEDHFAFGPGATTSRKRIESDAVYKIGCKPDVTQDCALLAWCAVYRIPRWFELLSGSLPSGNWRDDLDRHPPEKIFTLVPGNRVVTVPNNTKTERVIAIEPDLNMFIQKGLGRVLRHRLRRAGIDLNTQRKNQMLARKGSIYGNLASVDFSSASDTISREIVDLLLPEDWALALKQCRSPVGVLPCGRVVQYHKFSSMGNGYTFELESLIFWAIARAVSDLCTPRLQKRAVVMVYGDDLIVNAKLQDQMTWAFSRAGFTLNPKKSFFSGPFRESCGKHYFAGVDVTPFYVRKEIRQVWHMYTIANNIRRWARLNCWGLDSRLKASYDLIVGALPLWSRQLIPDGIGDVGLIADFDEARPKLHKKDRLKGIINFSATGYLPRVKEHSFEGFSVLVKWFLLRRESALEQSVEVAQRVTADVAVRHNFRVQLWPSYGPWV